MITLITGAPGSGKTNFLIPEILKYGEEGRPLFQHGIDELKLPNTKIYCRSSDCSLCIDPPSDALFVDEWPMWSQPHYVLIVDEVQNIWRPRGSKSTDIPVGLRKLETHRHEGIDFWFMTQHPSFLDVHARRLVTRHIHIKVARLGRQLYDMPEVCIDISKPSVAGKLHTLDKKAFGLYKSAKVNTKVKFTLPGGGVFYLLFFLGVIPFVVYYVYGRLSSFSGSVEDAIVQTTTAVEGVADIESVPIQRPTLRSSEISQDLFDPDIYDYNPRINNYPETAPAYSPLVEVLTFPRVAGCISRSRADCKCYTQQGTKTETSLNFCLAFIDNTHFNPYLETGNVRPVTSDSTN